MAQTTVADFLRTVPMFQGSSDEQLDQIAAICVKQHYHAGDFILEQGQTSQAYYFLCRGRVAARVDRVTGRETVATLDPPAIFGELSCITGEPCSADIEVLYDSEVLMMPRDTLQDIADRQPEVLQGLIWQLAKRLHTTVVQGARAPEFPIVLLREHPTWEASAAFSETLVQSLASQVNRPSLLVKIGGVRAATDLRQLSPQACTVSWPAMAGDMELCTSIAAMLPEWQQRFKSIVLHPIGGDRLAIADSIDKLATEQGELLGPGDPYPAADKANEMNDSRSTKASLEDHGKQRFIVGSGRSPQLPLLSGSQQLLFDAAESERNYLFGEPLSARFHRTVDSIARHIFRIQVGLACGGGGAWGFAHIGVLKTLEEAGIPIDVVAGNSAGTLIGAMHCCGRSVGDIRDQIMRLTKNRLKLFEFRIWKMHLIREKTVTRHFKRAYGDVLVNQTEIPFWANALNIENGEEINVTDGLLRSAVRASICLPGLFPPVVVKSSLVIDAGLMNSVPVEQIQEMGCRFAIATNVMQELKAQKLGREYPKNLLHIIYRAMMSQGHEVGAARCERAADVVIKPDAGQITLLGFHHVDDLIACGQRAAERELPLIRAAYDRLRARC